MASSRQPRILSRKKRIRGAVMSAGRQSAKTSSTLRIKEKGGNRTKAAGGSRQAPSMPAPPGGGVRREGAIRPHPLQHPLHTHMHANKKENKKDMHKHTGGQGQSFHRKGQLFHHSQGGKASTARGSFSTQYGRGKQLPPKGAAASPTSHTRHHIGEGRASIGQPSTYGGEVPPFEGHFSTRQRADFILHSATPNLHEGRAPE